MKKIICCFLFISTPLFSAQICGPTVTNLEYSYTIENPSGTIAGYWAAGTGCANGETTGDINTSCENIIVTGRAKCESINNSSQITGKIGSYCYCNRLTLASNDEIRDDIGLGICIAITENCMNICSQICADTIVNNTTGYRNPIMLLPAE